MDWKAFFNRQIDQIRQGGAVALVWKLRQAGKFFRDYLLCLLFVPLVLLIRMLRPWLLVRWGGLINSRIGHFAANTELYLCERDAGLNNPGQRYVDVFYLLSSNCNEQLAVMWKRVLHIAPSWLLSPVSKANRLLPGGVCHNVGSNAQHDRDIHNLLDRFPAHLEFTPAEEERGRDGLLKMGIPPDASFVCLIVRDSAYLEELESRDWSYQNYRDSNIQNYVPAVEKLAERGYFVIRMGSRVRDAMNSTHRRCIDYAFNGMRNDFMDIYLGAKCSFCVSTGTGFDAVPLIFRRPIAYVNMVPLGYLFTFRTGFLGITKHHRLATDHRELTLREIFSLGVGFCQETAAYTAKGVILEENSPEEILDLVTEMDERLRGCWQSSADDEELQRRFWEIYPTDAVDVHQGRPLHGEIRARFGSKFLRKNPAWLQRTAMPLTGTTKDENIRIVVDIFK